MEQHEWWQSEEWEDEKDKQCINRIHQSITSRKELSFNFIETLYYTHGIHSTIQKYIHCIPTQEIYYWSIILIKLLMFILKNKKKDYMKEIRLFWVSGQPIPQFIIDVCNINRIDTFEICRHELLTKVIELHKETKEQIQPFFIIDENIGMNNEIENIMNTYPSLYLSHIYCIDDTNNYITVKCEKLIKELDQIEMCNNPIRMIIIDFILSIDGSGNIPIEIDYSKQNDVIEWKDNIFEKSVDHIENALIYYTGNPIEISCTYNGTTYPIKITNPLIVKDIIEPINPHFVGEYMLSVLGGSTILIRINSGELKRKEFIYEKEMKAGGVQTIIMKCFDCFDNITSIGLLQMKLTHHSKEIFIEVEQSKIGYISCTPVLYDSGEYQISILNDANEQIEQITFTVLPLEIDDSLTQVSDNSNTQVQNICLIEEGVNTSFQLHFFDQFHNPMDAPKDLVCLSNINDIQCHNNEIQIKDPSLGEYTLDVQYTSPPHSVCGFPKKLIVIEKQNNLSFQWQIPKQVILGQLLIIKCITLLKRIDLISATVTINDHPMKSMIIQTSEGFDIHSWCIQFGNGNIKLHYGSIEKEDSFKVIKGEEGDEINFYLIE
ncbi:hypothetical protein ENUP19_0041G0042 [Entamoeba nuttalli]|uniref:Uncharacterized protein n=2 Tax=Entamoeba nuttalli TaxID=412467 RepID=K2HH75_ENTNP|nr:hypothetical protein ENU1_026570 [Entamoeba nuttalli P19]EKE42279.1 hypothetical protein ENU1_026570 [Entamoeba nuttalli P19]|eukprot:XP_008855390.1 hypothetical protein ENU1_026570 [Entamoeba nuttalli P19]